MSTNSWRVRVNFDNRSGRVLPSADAIGATVLKAPRGTTKPIYFSPGQTKRILELIGRPSPQYPGILEAIQYNNSYPLYISAPSLNGTHGGVLVTTEGVLPLVGGVSDGDLNFSEFPASQLLGTGDGLTESFNESAEWDDYYIPLSMKLYLNGEEIAGHFIEENTTTGVEEISNNLGSGTYTPSTGALEFTFTDAPDTGDLIEFKYAVDVSNLVYFTLLSKSPSEDHVAAEVNFDTDSSTFEINVWSIDHRGRYNEIDGSPFVVSLDEDAQDGFGQPLFIEQVFENNDYVIPVVNTALMDSTVSYPPTGNERVDFEGGNRGDEIGGEELVEGWEFFKQARRYTTDIFFDTSADPLVAAEFNTLRNNFQKYSSYIIPLPNVDVTGAFTAFQSLSLSNRGIAAYWNWGEVLNPYRPGNILSPLTGRIAVKHADIRINAFGGMAPAWIDENGMGGQLGGGIVRMIHDPDESQLRALDEARINPVVFDPSFGVMIMSRRTTIAELSDFSFIDYSGLIDYAVRNIVTQVLPFQLVKLNDTVHRRIVKDKAEAILSPMTVPPVNVLREFHVRCDETNNTDEVLSREEFVLTISVKVQPKSRTIVFNFVNTAQGANVEEETA